jgi:hypothetical protein
MSFQSTRVGWSFLNQSLALPCKLSFVILIGTYLPTYLPQICPFDMDKNLTNQMVHTLPIKKTTPITTDMSKSICPK